jgi:hypothetical protein
LLGVILGLIGLTVYQNYSGPDPNLKVIIDPSARGRVSNVTCSVDSLGNADAQGFVRDYDEGLVKIGAEFYARSGNLIPVDSGPVYTYFDTSDPASGEASGVLGFSVVAPESILDDRPTTCRISVAHNDPN